MNDDQLDEQFATGTQVEPRPEHRPPGHAQEPDAAEPLELLRRIERSLSEIHDRLEAREHERRHQEFSVARLIGSLVQALVVGFLIAAIADWVYNAPVEKQLVKLAFAGVLQLLALTAFTLTREQG